MILNCRPWEVPSTTLSSARFDPDARAFRLFCKWDSPVVQGKQADLPSPQSLADFCFPLGVAQMALKEYIAPEEYSYTLTGGDGSHLHGFCRSLATQTIVVCVQGSPSL